VSSLGKTSKKMLKKPAGRIRRKSRIRGRLSGTAERPRLCVFRSAKNIYAQLIDDVAGKTIFGISNMKKGNKDRIGVSGCHELGKKLGEVCKEKKIESVVFDRNGFVYHGRVKAVADGARETGLKL